MGEEEGEEEGQGGEGDEGRDEEDREEDRGCRELESARVRDLGKGTVRTGEEDGAENGEADPDGCDAEDEEGCGEHEAAGRSESGGVPERGWRRYRKQPMGTTLSTVKMARKVWTGARSAG